MNAFLQITLSALLLTAAIPAGSSADDAAVVDIRSRRELFVDAFLIESLTGEARQILHHPTPREVVLVTDQTWEGNGLNYVTVFQDGDIYKMYYRGADFDRGVACIGRGRILVSLSLADRKTTTLSCAQRTRSWASLATTSARFWMATPTRRMRNATRPLAD